ncbi:hypothetical protein ACMA1D_10845 [Streptomyces sp. 796.1]|uniref:hypothetical protein n=1 Tax=Streptomyces sp. 796.1 TaxID=3163029 RepID=UPI0039C9B45B
MPEHLDRELRSLTGELKATETAYPQLVFAGFLTFLVLLLAIVTAGAGLTWCLVHITANI